MKPTEKRESVPTVAKSDICAEFSETCRRGTQKLRELYLAEMDSHLEQFRKRASASDIHVLGDVLQTWQNFVTGDGGNVLVGAMAELFE